MIVYPTGGGTGVVGMAKAFDELEALGLVGAGPSADDLRPERARPTRSSGRSQSGAGRHHAQAPREDHRHRPERRPERRPHQRLADHPGDRRAAPWRSPTTTIRDVIRGEWRDRRFAWSPEGAATLAGSARAGGPRARSAPATGSSWSTRPRPRSTCRRSATRSTADCEARGRAGRRRSADRRSPGESVAHSRPPHSPSAGGDVEYRTSGLLISCRSGPLGRPRR